MKPEWAINIQKQCTEQKATFFFKQWGTWGEDCVKRNKKENGSIFLGREWKEEPKCFNSCCQMVGNEQNRPARKRRIW